MESPTSETNPQPPITDNPPTEVFSEVHASSGILLQQIAELQAEIAKHQDTALRAFADLDNYRKRALREKDEMRRFATSSIMESLLPILDNLQLGLDAAKDQTGSVVQGFQMVADQLLQVLKDFGLLPLSPEGQIFDPNTQDCVAHIPHDTIPDNHVVQVVRKGYFLNERLLRPASVIVSSGAKPSEQP